MYDSTSASICMHPLPNSEVFLVDCCRLHATQGSTADIANEASLRSAMGSCSFLRPVVLIDLNIIDKGVFQMLDLLLRLFSPIEQFLPNLTFIFFTHHDKGVVLPDHVARLLFRWWVSSEIRLQSILSLFVRLTHLDLYIYDHRSSLPLSQEGEHLLYLRCCSSVSHPTLPNTIKVDGAHHEPCA
jgi:hypothetical protein